MGDFHQHGTITTLHSLNQRPINELEDELRSFSKKNPMALLLPSLYSELEGPALANIVEELRDVDYLSQIVVGLDCADEDQYRNALQFFNCLPQKPQIMWHDGPRLRAIDALLQSYDLAPPHPGKGRNVWYMFGYILATEKAKAVALHDCDILTYKRDLLARLIYPVVHPNFSYKFCKGFYSRIASEKLNGRACRLLVTPLIRAMKQVCGPNEYLDYLDSFRYALAGEFSMKSDVLEDIRIPADWGLEMGVLSELQRNYSNNQICQVDIADNYDHKHQILSESDRSKGLSKMSADIAKSLFRKMATQGTVFSTGTIRTIKATYYRIALDLIDSYNNDALINGLSYDRHKEGQAVELFAENILHAGQDFLEKAMESPFMPSWKRVTAAVPDIFERLVDAVEKDHRDFSAATMKKPVLSPSTQRLKERISLHLSEIYGSLNTDICTDTLSDKLMDQLNLSTSHLSNTKQDKWSEDDVVLITYGDTIKKSDKSEPPLRTLHRFLHRELNKTINSVHILPFSPFSSDDGFSVIDYDAINPELGTWQEVEAIASEFKLMADLVINHCSSQSKWFKNFLKDKSPGKSYFIVPKASTDLSKVIRPRATPLLSEFKTEKGEKSVWCTFSADQIDLNYANPEVLFEVIRILCDYLKHGIRLFRLDAVAFLWKESGTECVHLHQTHEIIKLIRLVIESIEPSALIITETNVPNRENLSYFGNDNEAHMIYNFSLPPLLINSLLTGDCSHLKTWMMSMPPAKRGRTYLNFIASHDGIGVRPAEGLLHDKELSNMLSTLSSFGGHISMRRMPDGQDKPYEVNISLFDALKNTVDAASSESDQWHIERYICAHTIMLALEGIPAIYIHSLLGTHNNHDLAKQTGRARSINRSQWDINDLNEQLQDPSSHHMTVFNRLKKLIKIRRKQAAFHPNATQYTLHLGSSLFAFWRESLDRHQNVFAIHNISKQVQKIPLVELNLISTETWYDLLSEDVYHDLNTVIELAPYQCAWITNKT
ncbi:alpha-amylase family glycosyl hydrolase [Lentisphaera profundi]|uniref:Alpha-amylase family glycosyl hydrolase n=1 Tax=Lentisphaera profundi TaxID=1658616 RepID=A0ABY7W4K9_9BACT|nr:alpha-amylase family glycosyl hydrolase [Lentisphaera profundi]WDE99178.1 alpha-amylase family glycosyl hydrolase [Lentisphaera profundi]